MKSLERNWQALGNSSESFQTKDIGQRLLPTARVVWGSEERKGKQVTSGVALRGQVRDWVKGQVHAFEGKAEGTKLPCGCVGIRGQGKKVQEREEGVRKIQNSSRKKPHLPQHRSQAECSRNRLEVFVYSVLPPWDPFSPLSLGKDLVFLQVLSLTLSAKKSQLFWALRSKSLISALCEIFTTTLQSSYYFYVFYRWEKKWC